MKSLIKNQKGSVLVLTSVAMIVIIGFAALVIDGGNLYYRHMRLQDIADACSLAACQELANTTQDDAIDKAIQYTEINGIEVKSVEEESGDINVAYGGEEGLMKISFPTNNKVKVYLDIDTKMYLARVLGFNGSKVAVASVAKYGVAKNQKQGIWPVGLEKSVIKSGADATLIPDESDKGNYGFLCIDGNGDNDLTAALKNGCSQNGVSIGDKIKPKPGVALQMNKGGQEIIDRFNCGCGTNSANYWEHNDNCSRYVVIAIVTDFGPGSSTDVEALAFAKVFLKEYKKDKNKVTIPAVTLVKQTDNAGELLDPDKNKIDDTYLVKAVRLVE